MNDAAATRRVIAYLPTTLAAELERRAHANERSVTAELRVILREAVRQERAAPDDKDPV